jgi:hypothetical protein
MHWDAFRPGDLFTHLFSNVSVPQKLAIEEKQFLAGIENKKGGNCVIKAMRAGKMVGYAYWHLPKDPGTAEAGNEAGREFPEGSRLPAARDFFGDIDRRNDKLMSKPHYGSTVLFSQLELAL